MRTRMMLVATLIAACSSGSSTRSASDCEAYAQRFAMLIDPDPARKETALAGARSACEKGRVTDAQIRCIDDASSQDGARACMGLGPVVKSAPTKPGLSRLAIVGIEGGGITTGALTARQTMWRDELAANLESCERIAVPDGKPTSFEVVVTYGSGFRGKVDGAGIPEPFRECISERIAAAKPPSTTRISYNAPIAFRLTAQPAP